MEKFDSSSNLINRNIGENMQVDKEIFEKLGITIPEAKKVMTNLQISEANQEFMGTMGKIAEEMAKQKNILEVDVDTGEPLKIKGTELSALKEKELKETRKNLTRPSKYIKGAVFAGLVATGLFADMVEYGPISDAIYGIEALEITELVTMFAVAGMSLYKIGKAISQEVKSRVVADKKVQRVIAFMASGFEKKNAQQVVGIETNTSGYREGEKGVLDYEDEGYTNTQYTEARKKLEEMGVKPISRTKYKG
ncbi:MAG: hypothetical protein AAB636_00940 [Patescibacteria group bacterium]